MSDAFQNVHVRVLDAHTGKPVAVRLRLTDDAGRYFAPFGRLAEFATGVAEDVGGNVLLGDKKFAYIDGACEIRLPVGTIHVEIHRGPEYLPVFQTVQLPKGKLAMRFTIERWSNVRDDGWYAGDTHCFHMSPHAALLEAAGEDLAVVNLLARLRHVAESAPTIPNMLAFSGQQPALATPEHMVVVNTLNEHAHLGQLALLNCHRAVFPLTFGGPDGVDDWNLADWCEQCHRKKGLVIATEYLREADQREILADAVLGYIDTFDVGCVDLNHWEELVRWEELLACELRLPLSAGSGKDSNRQQLGRVRTYANLSPEEELTYQNWIEAVRVGRTFVSNGPMLTFTIGDHGPGEQVDTSGEPLPLHARAQSLSAFDTLEIRCNGALLKSTTAQHHGDIYVATLETEISLDESAWLTAHCHGNRSPSDRAACTSPIYVIHRQQPFRPHLNDLQQIQKRLGDSRVWLRKNGNFANDHQHQRMDAVYHEALGKMDAL